MELNQYQEQAMTTCMESSNNFSYMFLNLVGEVGEFASKVAKSIRKNKMNIGEVPVNGEDPEWQKNKHFYNMTAEEAQPLEDELMKEAGDVLWQLAGLCSVMGWTLEDVARMNLDKLSARKQAGTIDGNGDGVSGADRTTDQDDWKEFEGSPEELVELEKEAIRNALIGAGGDLDNAAAFLQVSKRTLYRKAKQYNIL